MSDITALLVSLVAQRAVVATELTTLIGDKEKFWAKEAEVRALDERIAQAQRAKAHAAPVYNI